MNLKNPFSATELAGCRVLVVGDVMLDRYWFGEVERISPEAPVPIVRVMRVEDRLGGAANVARNVVTLGAQATLIGMVGMDEAGDRVQVLGDEMGITLGLVRDANQTTTLKMRVLGHQQQLLRVDFEALPTAAALDRLDEEISRHLLTHDVLVLSDYAKGALTRVEQIITEAACVGIPVFVDPKGDSYSIYKNATLVTPNRGEMQQAVGRWYSEEDLTQRAQRLRENLNLEALLMTRSEQGMTLFTDAGREHVETQVHEVFDVSGAGDTVLATLAVARALRMPWQQAVHLANRAGGVVVGKLGTSTVTREELGEE